jgi:hypothetical protein
VYAKVVWVVQGYYWKFYLSGINEIYDFFISIVFSFPFGDMANFFKKFKQRFSFQISKIKISN